MLARNIQFKRVRLKLKRKKTHTHTTNEVQIFLSDDAKRTESATFNITFENQFILGSVL